MSENTFLQYLPGNKSFQLLKQLIRTFYGFDLALLNLNGEPFMPAMVRSSFSHEGLCKERRNGGKKRIISEGLLQELRAAHQSRILKCGQHGRKQLLVPILRKKVLMGFLFLEEGENGAISDTEAEITINFLEDYVRLLVKTDLEFVEYFQNANLTHQQCIIQEVIKYIHENYHDTNLSLKKAASWKGVSYYYLSSLFAQEVHTPFIKYLTKIRIETACRLLLNKNLTISQVANQCGFDDPGYFSKAFRRAVGESPLDYREHHHPQKRKNGKRLVMLPAAA